MIRTQSAQLAQAIFVFVALGSAQASEKQSNLLGISQGISSPSMTSNLTTSNGFTAQNPVGLSYVKSVHFGAMVDFNSDKDDNESDAMSAEAGWGNGKVGLGAGYYKSDCDKCEAVISGGLGLSFKSVGIGGSISKNKTVAGFLLFPDGEHRFGVTAQQYRVEDGDIATQGLGVGYSFVATNVRFSIDASKSTVKRKKSPTGLDFDETTTLVTPGIGFQNGNFSLSASHNFFIEEKNVDIYENGTWYGLGYGSADSWHLALYHDYRHSWSLGGNIFL